MGFYYLLLNSLKKHLVFVFITPSIAKNLKIYWFCKDFSSFYEFFYEYKLKAPKSYIIITTLLYV